MKRATDNAITVRVDGREFRTLRDLLPESPGLDILFVAKTPAPESVQKGHYFQGKQGRSFWKMLKQYGILTPTTDFEDDILLQHGYGLTDIAKEPRPFGQEPSREEYRTGARRIPGTHSIPSAEGDGVCLQTSAGQDDSIRVRHYAQIDLWV